MWKRVAGYTVLTIIAVAGAGFGYLYLRPPKRRAPSDMRIEVTPARVERGKYVWTLAYCDGCHSQRDPKTFALIESGRGRGNVMPEPELPGRIVASNITPDPETGLGKWTDGEIIRAIREGIGKDGRALFPMMPYDHFRHMSDNDVYSLVAYMKTLKPIRNPLPRTEIQFPVSMLIKGVPKPVRGPVPDADKSDPRIYGEYLATVSDCETCHTPAEKGQIIRSKRFGGGRRFNIAGQVLYSANITPDPQTGIGGWTADYFKQRIYTYKNSYPQRFTIMPWHNLAQLPEEDLDAIFTYLKSQTPIDNKVNPFAEQLAQNR